MPSLAPNLPPRADWRILFSEERRPLNWFRPVGPPFRPASIAGWLISLAALSFCIQTFAAID
jgi:hypothetical protein